MQIDCSCLGQHICQAKSPIVIHKYINNKNKKKKKKRKNQKKDAGQKREREKRSERKTYYIVR